MKNFKDLDLNKLINAVEKNRSFDVKEFNQITECGFIKMYRCPKKMVDDNGKDRSFLEVGKTHDDRLICIGNGNHNFGMVYMYGWTGFYEYYTRNSDGEDEEYMQDDVYGFTVLANNIDEFVSQKLYCNGSFDNCDPLIWI